MTFWTYQNLADVTQGTWLVEPDDQGAHVAGLWHDTRDLKPGQAYLAIAGDNFDGHDFLDQAFAAGAALAIVSKPTSPKPKATGPTLRVPDTVKALQDLARAYRDELKATGCKVIGIAGSNGKTTTRHLIHHVLTHAGLKGIQSPKSFNNHLGVPLTLLSAKPEDDFVACEIGTNHPGEIDFLSAIARPDIAVITSIGEEHLEFFKTLANVSREEAAILNHVVPRGWVIVPEDAWSRYLCKHLQRTDLQIAHGAGLFELDAAADRWLSYGPHMESNANLASSVAVRLGVAQNEINSALACVKLPAGRCELFRYTQLTLIHDAYNANPTSALAAIDMLCTTAKGRRVMVFGDMLELGDHALSAHRSMGIQAESARVDLLITFGLLAKHAAQAAEQMPVIVFEDWSDDLPEKIADLLQPGDTVLLKASRGMRLERLIPAIEQRFGRAQGDEPT